MFRAALFTAALASDVVVLTDKTFDDFIKANDKVLVKFYAPWCGHCKKMAPEFESAATELKGKVPLADLDATVEKESGSKYGVSGYPTLKWFVDGEATEYSGGRDKAKIVEWVNSMSGPAVSTETPVEPTTQAVVILTSATQSEFFVKFANKNRQSAVFYYVSGSAETVTLQHAGEDVNTLKELNAEALDTFFAANKAPLVGELNGDTYGDYVSGGNGLVWVLFKHEEGKLQEARTEHADFLRTVALAVKGKFSVTFTDTIEFAQAIEGMLGITTFPAVAVQKKAGGKQKFVYDGGDLDATKVIAYINDVDSGKLVAELKSEPTPEEQGDVTVVVGNTLLEIVFSETRDVLLEVYAPWCGHCKKLEPEYDLLAKKISNEKMTDLITIAKMDGTLNDSPTDDIDWTGFPTIKYVKAGSKKVDSYEAGRTAKDMWAWIRENSSHKEEITRRLNAAHDSADKHDEL